MLASSPVRRRRCPFAPDWLLERRDDAFLYRKLATLVDTVPLEGSLEELKFLGVPRAHFERWCNELGVQRLKTAPRRWQ